MSKKYEQVELKFAEHKVPVKIYRENRRSVRYYLGKSGGILRLPAFLSREQERAYREQFEHWLKTQWQKRQELKPKREPKTYKDGDIIKVGSRTYRLSIQYEDRRTHSGRLRKGVMELKLSGQATPESIQKDIPTLLSRLAARDFLPEISRRVAELNERFFQKDVGNIRLKHTRTVWGSCSGKRNLNFSTRLLFAPPDVIDYVIIHELAHLVEMNHSKKFWQLVKNAMPDYKEKEKWLKKNGNNCNF